MIWLEKIPYFVNWEMTDKQIIWLGKAAVTLYENSVKELDSQIMLIKNEKEESLNLKDTIKDKLSNNSNIWVILKEELE